MDAVESPMMMITYLVVIVFMYRIYPNRSLWRASARISLFGENNYCDRNTTYPLYITSFHCYRTY